jgi:hypothetical protein
MKTLPKKLVFIALFICISCSKDDDTPTPIDVKTYFVGNWSGQQQINGISFPYAFNLFIYNDNTLKNIDLAFGSQEFPGTYTYTTDSLKINYNNGTRWKLKFLNNYSNCTGSVLGAQGAIGTVTMSKN